MSKNPYVGPRAFRVEEKLPAREREKHELTDLLIAERVVLLHAPSGAGKTSLVHAGVIPLLEQERLGENRFRAMLLRVKTPVPEDSRVYNRYIYSVALDLVDHGLLLDHDPQELVSTTLLELLSLVRAGQQLANVIPVLIFDQFEEILTLDPTDRNSQNVFFGELGSLLADETVWALFAMREDYIGGLAPFAHYFPDYLRTTYRLDFLETSAAKIAIQEPAHEQHVTFSDEAADKLLRQLATVKVQRPGTRAEETHAPYVLPFQLQVMCRGLWKSLAEEQGDAFKSIELDDIETHVDVDAALRDYYADTVRMQASRAEEPSIRELEIRDWFERQLITEWMARRSLPVRLAVANTGGANAREGAAGRVQHAQPWLVDCGGTVRAAAGGRARGAVGAVPGVVRDR